MLVERGEDGALAPENVDVADKSVGGIAGSVIEDIEVEAEFSSSSASSVGLTRPGIAFGGEDRRARRVEARRACISGG